MSQIIKLEKLNSLISREINMIIKKEFSNNPILQEMTIHEVVTTNDYSQSKIYYSFISKNYDLEDLKKAISRYNKNIRFKLASRLNIYKTPKLIFIYDKTLDNVANIEKILKNIK